MNRRFSAKLLNFNICIEQLIGMSVDISSSIDTQDLYTPGKLKRSRRQTHNQHSIETRLSLRKNHKVKADNESQQSKITNFFAKKEGQLSNPTSDCENQDKISKEHLERIRDLELRLKEKDEQNADLRLKCEAEVLKAQFKKEEFRKNQEQMAASMLLLAEIKRKQRARVDYKLGYFIDNFRKFVEGEALTVLRNNIQLLELSLKKLEEEKKIKSANSTESICLQSSFEFKTKQLQELRKELQYKEAEVSQYKERLKLVEQEDKSQYSAAKWPIIYGRYQTLELLGSGGFGEVYKCYDVENNKFVAIKKIVFDNRVSLKYKQEFFRHVEREVEIQKTLSHPNIAKLQNIIEIDQSKNCVVFQLQYCSGPQLSKYMKKYTYVPEKEAKLIIKQVLCALNYLYNLKEKVIHYDLKPKNIMFHNGIIKVVDFGLCKVMENSEDTRIELTSQGVGTYYYLPPQTFEDYNPLISSKVDIWSVGVIFYEMLYGKKPFGHGLSQNQIFQSGVILRARKVEFPQEITKKQKISDGAKDFIESCLRYNPDERLNPLEAYEHPYLKKLN